MGFKKRIRELGSSIKKYMHILHLYLKHYYYQIISKYDKDNYKEIPIIINNFNRLIYLKKLIKSLQLRGYSNIIILDNKSTYPPLLDWYQNECDVKIIYLNENFGHIALWKSGIISQFDHDYFCYTDPDLELLEQCPENFLMLMLYKIKHLPFAEKIGLSLKIADIPDCYAYKDKVLNNESRFYEIFENGMYRADIDTTFAIYKPYASGGYVDNIITYRMPYPIQCRHLPWYEDSSVVSDEDKYYLAHKRTDVSWWMQPSEKVGKCPN